MDSFKQGNNSETSSEEIDQPEKLANDDNAGTGRLYECNFCKRGFTNAQALGGHMNIHRKDKAKLAKSKQVPSAEPSMSSKLSKEFMTSNNFPLYMSEQASYYTGFGSHMSYQTFLPTRDSSVFYADSDSSLRMGKGSTNANLSLGIGKPYMEQNQDKKRGGEIDIDTGDEVDLELRLGHNKP